MKLLKDSILINEIMHQESCDINVDGDIIVPDIKPDILKILQVDAVSCITGKEIQNNKINITGKVNLKILYIPDRSEEAVKSILTSFDFSHQIDKANLPENIQTVTECDVVKVDFTLINSRKLNVKTIVSIESAVFSGKSIEMTTDIENDIYTEINRKPFGMYNTFVNTDEEFVVKDTLEVPSGKISVKDILKIDYKISDKEFKAVTGKLVAKGTVNVCVLYIGDNNGIEFMEADVPFTEVFGISEITEDSVCEITYCVNDMNYEVCEDSDGDNRILNIEFLVGAHVTAGESIQIDIVDDFYCPGSEIKITREEQVINNIVCQTGTQNNLREIIPIGDNFPQIAEVYNVITKAYITNTSIEHNKLLAEGIIDCYILYLSDNSDNPVFSYKKEIPFNYMLDTPGCSNSMECMVTAEVEHSSYSLNMASEVELRCILSVSAKVIDKKNISLITDFEINELAPDEKMGIVIYFVQPGDTLWNIAKHYHIAIDDIVKINDIDTGTALNIGRQLIIPSSRKKPA